MRNYNITGVILKSSNIKDSDKIYCILSKESGKIFVLGKGVRKISSRRAGNLDTVNLVSAKISENSKGFKQIEEVKTINSFREIKKSYDLSCKAYYMAELIYRNIEEGEVVEKILEKFVSCLKALSGNKVSSSLIVNHFELEFLKLLGYEFQQRGNIIKTDIYGILEKLQKGVFPKEINPEDEKEINFTVKNYLNKHLDQKIKSLELSIK